MRVSAPVTDYIRASVINTKGDLFTRGDLVPERLAAGLLDTYLKAQGAGELPIWEKLSLLDTGVKITDGSHAAAGDKVITGIGFEPSAIIFLAHDNVYTNKNGSIGFGNVVYNSCLTMQKNGAEIRSDSLRSIRVYRSSTEYMYAVVSAVSSDGLTLTFTGANVFMINFTYLCLP